MVDKYKYSTSQLLNFTRDSYLERTSRPIYALVFLLPFIVFYELGTILINTDVLNRTQDRVVAFIWLQSFLDSYLGLGSRFAWVAPPLTVVIVLLALQITSRKRWYFVYADIVPMTIECILLAAPLIVLSLILSGPAESNSNITPSGYASLTQVVADCSEDPSAPSIVEVKPRLRVEDRRTVPVCSSLISCELRSASARTNSNNERSSHLLANIVTGIGAGIYEELIFRLILICVLMMLFQDVMGFEHKNSIILSVLISAALFSAHHHIVFVNGQVSLTAPFNRTVFGFRAIAGVYFAALFAIRGFGITAGTHAFYDIIATIINIVFFHH
jgi:general stress protein CsbA